MKSSRLLVVPCVAARIGFALSAVVLTMVWSESVEASCNGLFGDPNRASQEVQKRRRSLLAPVARSEFGFDEVSVRAETHELLDLVSDNPAENLVLQHPSMAMGAFQRMWSWIVSRGTREVYDSGFRRERRTLYRAISEHMPLNGGRFIVGQLESVEALAGYIKNGAAGDAGARKKTLVLLGPSGTGKTEFVDILTNVGRNLTGADANHFMFTFEWVGLERVPELQEFINSVNDGESTFARPIRSPYYQSPIVLLPRGYQKAILESARDRVREVSGFDPSPLLEIDAQSAFIREAIFRRAQQVNPELRLTFRRGEQITPELEAEIAANQLEVLNEYIQVKRFVAGMDNAIPVIDVQGKDVPYDSLTMAKNGLNFVQFGPGHPFSYHLNGKILQSSGMLLVLEEQYRHPKDFRDFMLGVKESRVVQRGAAPKTPLDTVVIAATNEESIQEVKSAGGSDASFSRDIFVPMMRDYRPANVEWTTVLMKGTEGLVARKLTSDFSRNDIPSDLDGLFEKVPYSELYDYQTTATGRPRTPGQRFALAYRRQPGAPMVQIAPHTLEMISYFTAVTRMVVDPAAAIKLGPNYDVINTAVFKDPIVRLRALLGEVEVPPAHRHELGELSKFMREGMDGLDQRDVANIWFTQVIAEAEKPENNHTATPEIAMEVFRRLINEDHNFRPKTDEMRRNWNSLLARIVDEIIVPRIKNDVYAAVGQTRGSVISTYDEVYREIIAIDENPDATTYSGASNQLKRIDKERLEKIAEIYQGLHQETLPVRHIIRSSALDREEDGNARRHQGLITAIEHFYAEQTFKTVKWVDFANFARTGTGTVEIQTQVGDTLAAMIMTRGYNPYSARAAFELNDKIQAMKEELAEARN